LFESSENKLANASIIIIIAEKTNLVCIKGINFGFVTGPHLAEGLHGCPNNSN